MTVYFVSVVLDLAPEDDLSITLCTLSMLLAFFEPRPVLITGTLPGFIGLVVLGSSACLFLIIGSLHFFKRNRLPLTRTGFLRRLTSDWAWLLWLVVITDVFLISNHLLLRGLAVGIWDVNGAYYPYQTLVADHARAGQLLHWDPWSDGGLPTGGDPQFGAYSPVNLVIGLIAGGTTTGFLIYWLLMWWLGGAGMMLLARHLKAPPWGGGVVALGFLFSGTYIGHAEHTSLINAYSLLPFVIWRLDVALGSGRRLPAVEAGALWGASALSGYPAMVIISGLFVGMWGLGRWLCPEPAPIAALPDTERPDTGKNDQQRRPGFRYMVEAIAIVPLVGVLVLAPTYFSYFYAGAGTSTRVGVLPREMAVSDNALSPGAIAGLSSPYLPILKVYSQTGPGKGLWPGTDVSGCALYTGVIISVFALLALLSRPRVKWRWWLLGIGLLNLAFAVGPALPFRGWLYDWFYPTRYFRHSGIFRTYFLFAIAVLALVGIRDLGAALASIRDRIRQRFFAASVLSATCALIVFFSYMFSPAIERLSRNGERFALWHAAIVWTGLIVIAVIGWMAPPATRTWCVPLLLLILAASDAFMTTSISIGIMADTSPTAIRRWEKLDEKHSPSLDLTSTGLRREEISRYRDGAYLLDRTNDQMITKIPAFNTYATAVNNYQSMIANNPKMRRIAVGTDRIWFSSQASRLAPSDGNFAAFGSRVDVLGNFPLLVHSTAEMLSIGKQKWPNLDAASEVAIFKVPAIEPVPVNLIRYTPGELTFEVQCATDGWLLVTDRWARGWRAEVNDTPVELYGGNFIFRALQVAAGQNKVSFIYQVRGFPWLVILSWGTLAGIALASVNQAIRNNAATS